MDLYAGDFAKLPDAALDATVDALTEDEAGELQYNWSFWARPEQRLPDGNWINWLILAGRGYGKTRVGAETVRQWVKRYQYVNLIGATVDDVRTIMVEGESGILATCRTTNGQDTSPTSANCTGRTGRSRCCSPGER